MLRIILIVSSLGLIFAYPAFLLIFSLVNFFVVAIKNLFSNYFLREKGPKYYPPQSKIPKSDFISILIAIHNEPPLLVKNTLLSLSKQNYTDCEILVLDNNTTDKSLWEPVQKFCEDLGPRFKFYHIENLTGFKAGALNWLIKKINSKTKFIAVIDADYEVDQDFLSTAIEYFTEERIAFVQLPQAYKNVCAQNKGLAVEYEYFFANYMQRAQNLNCITATGTLGIFRTDVLKKLGGFNTSTITEDADLGTRVALAGYSGTYVPRIMGAGLMPHSLDDLKKQRNRWAIGNAQVLKKYFFLLLTSRNLNWKQKSAILSQLTAWANFTFPASFIIIVLGALKLLSISKPIWDRIFLLCFVTLVMFFILKTISFLKTFNKKYPKSVIFRALFVHIGMNYIYSVQYFSGLLNLKFNFIRTNKFVNKSVSTFFGAITDEILLIFVISSLSFALFFIEEYFYSLVVLIVALAPLAIFFTLKEAIATETESQRFYSKIKNNTLGL